MPAAPDVLNYQLATGKGYWTPSGGSERDLGNVVSGTIQPNITFLDHFRTYGGARSKDRSVASELSATLVLTLDEIMMENLAMQLFGGDGSTVTANTATNKEFEILSRSETVGLFRFVGDNNIGNRVTVNLPTVSIQPSGIYNLISAEDWNTIELTGEVLNSTGTFGTVEETLVAS